MTRRISEDLCARLAIMLDLGLGYLTLERSLVPGVEMGGQFLLEINTYSTDKVIQTFKQFDPGQFSFGQAEHMISGNVQ